MGFIKREIISTVSAAASGRWPDPEQLVCPMCDQKASPQQPAYWRMADGPVPAWSHENNREPLCWVLSDDGARPATPVARKGAGRPAQPASRQRATGTGALARRPA